MRENEQLTQNRTTINHREKTIGFVYVLLLFLAVSICCCMIIFWTNSDFDTTRQKDIVLVKVEKIKKFQETQKEYKPVVDPYIIEYTNSNRVSTRNMKRKISNTC